MLAEHFRRPSGAKMKFATCLSGFTGRRMVTLAPRIAANFNMTLLDGSIRTNSLIKRVLLAESLVVV
jgi:hypothetical protein